MLFRHLRRRHCFPVLVLLRILHLCPLPLPCSLSIVLAVVFIILCCCGRHRRGRTTPQHAWTTIHPNTPQHAWTTIYPKTFPVGFPQGASPCSGGPKTVTTLVVPTTAGGRSRQLSSQHSAAGRGCDDARSSSSSMLVGGWSTIGRRSRSRSTSGRRQRCS